MKAKDKKEHYRIAVPRFGNIGVREGDAVYLHNGRCWVWGIIDSQHQVGDEIVLYLAEMRYCKDKPTSGYRVKTETDRFVREEGSEYAITDQDRSDFWSKAKEVL